MVEKVFVSEAESQQLLQEIGAEVSRIAARATGQILNYVEADDGVISTAVYFARAEKVIFKFPTDELVDLLESFWRATRVAEPDKQWHEMAYIVNGGRFRVEFFYADDVIDLPPDEKQRMQIRHYFGVEDWDDSDPRPD